MPQQDLTHILSSDDHTRKSLGSQYAFHLWWLPPKAAYYTAIAVAGSKKILQLCKTYTVEIDLFQSDTSLPDRGCMQRNLLIKPYRRRQFTFRNKDAFLQAWQAE